MEKKDYIKRFHAALSGAKMQQYKADMLSGYGVESSKGLSNEQLQELTDRLNAMQQSRFEAPPQVRKARSVVLTLLTAYGVYTDNNDWSRVNKFLLNPRIAGKLLYEMTEEELRDLARKLRVMVKKRNEQKGQEDFLAANN